MLKFVAVFALAALATAIAWAPEEASNMAFPVAAPPIPNDKCSVAGANDADMRLTLVAWGYDSQYYMAKQGENWGEFGEWTPIEGYFSGGPTVIRNANNDIVVFGRGGDRRLLYSVFPEGTTEPDWVPLGGRLLSGRISALVDAQGLIHVFGRGRDSAVYEKRQYANGTQAIWGEWTSLGGIVTSNVEAIMDNEGLIHLFARGVEGALWSMTQKIEVDGSALWAGWTKTDDNVYLSSAATIKASLNAQNLIELVVRVADKSFWHTRETINDQRGVVWAPWKNLGGIMAGAPSLAINTDYLITVFGRGPDKGAWYKQQAHHPVDSVSDAWSKWVPLGGRFSATLDTVKDSRGYINIFGRGLDRAVWHRGQMYSNKTVGFFGPWANLGGRFRSFAC